MNAWGAVRLSIGIIATVIGTALLLGSVPAAATAAAIQASVGRSGVVSQPLGTLAAAPSDVAVVVDGVDDRLVLPEPPAWVTSALQLGGTDVSTLAEDLGALLLVATPAEEGAFLGVAPVDAVNDYLDGSPYSVAVRQAGEWPVVSVPGAGSPPPPADQALWLASSEGPAPELDAQSLTGMTLVLMRPDAGAAPEAALRLEYRVPGADSALQSAAVAAAASSIGGLAIILLGSWLIVGRGRRPSPEGAAA
jgi:hypothetical protein